MSVSHKGRKQKGYQFEREMAKLFGGKRTPYSGATGGGDLTFEPGGIWADWSWELKRRAKIALVYDALDQARADIGIGGLRKPAALIRADHKSALFVAEAEDMKQWCEALAEVGQAHQIRDYFKQIERIASEAKGKV